jgi:hypothetical protein
MQSILMRYQVASQAAGRLLGLDHQVAATAQAEADLLMERSRLEQIDQGLSRLRESIQALPAGESSTIPDLRAQLLALMATSLDNSPPEQVLIDQLPPAGSLNSAYLVWIENAQPRIQAGILVNQEQSVALASERERLATAYQLASDQSRGLSATLEIAPLFEGIWQVQAIRSTSLVVLVGGLIGILVWGGYWTFRLARRHRSEVL